MVHMRFLKTIYIKIWKLEGELDNPKERRLNSQCPEGTVNVVRSRLSSFMGTCQNPLWRSSVVKYLNPCKEVVTFSKTGNDYVSNFVTEFSALKSTQNLYLGVPFGFFLGTKMAGADQGELLGLMPSLSSMFAT